VALEYRFRRKDGEYVWLRDEQRLVWGANGEPAEIIGTAVDITDVRKLEELLRQSQKMEAVGRLAGGVAHDFNNLLAVIRGNIDLTLMEGQPLSQDGRACLEAAIKAVESASGMIRQLLTFSRMQVAQTQLLELNGVIGKLVSMLERIIGKDIELKCSCTADLPFVEADPVMMEQVLINLVVNARDSMPKGGQLQIATQSVKVDHAYTTAHPEACTGEYIALSVTDTGTGIAPEHLPRIFEPFFSTKQAGKGTGLGLATVYGIVKQHHGWVEVSTQLGVGSTFRVFLPSKTGKPASVPKVPVSGPSGRGTETILLVDDEEGVRLSIRKLLERFGYKVREAASGREALQVWHAQAAEIDLLLTDINMPQGINGLELVEKVRAERRDVKVIYLSGYTEEMPERDTGFVTNTRSRFLQKPCSSQELIQTVRQSLDLK
jgi:signal transduction histidine kinase/CheY-like chemotaxis protein